MTLIIAVVVVIIVLAADHFAEAALMAVAEEIVPQVFALVEKFEEHLYLVETFRNFSVTFVIFETIEKVI